jgi:UDP-N-acetylmuramate dehydrogenase
MTLETEFAAVLQRREPLAPFTMLRIGGPVDYLLHPRTGEELVGIVKACRRENIALRILGEGANLLVQDDGINGAVVRMNNPAFARIEVLTEGASTSTRTVRAGGGSSLMSLISTSTKNNLSGLESLVGILGTVGGAVRCNAGDRSGEIGERVRRIEVIDSNGQIQWRDRSELHFSEHKSDLDDPVILSVDFELDHDSAERIGKRMRRAWIQRKATQPFSFEAAVRVFKNPRGYTATDLLEKAGLLKTTVGKAEVSERNANYILARNGASSRDVLRLIDLMRSKVKEVSGLILEQELLVW